MKISTMSFFIGVTLIRHKIGKRALPKIVKIGQNLPFVYFAGRATVKRFKLFDEMRLVVIASFC